MFDLEWDSQKAKRNLLKHSVAFTEAGTVFGDPLGITIFDPDHSDIEDRYITIGMSERGRLLMVAHTDREGRTRIITARGLTPSERAAYENEKRRRNP